MKIPFKVILLMVAAMPVLAWAIIWGPERRHNAELAARTRVLQACVVGLPATTAVTEKLQTQSDRLAKSIEAIRLRLPAEADVDDVLQDTWKLADGNKLVTKSVRKISRPKEPAPSNASQQSLGEQPVLMQVEGDFASVYKFLQDVEGQGRMIRVRKIDLRRVEGSSGNTSAGRIEADLTLSVYFERGGGTNKRTVEQSGLSSRTGDSRPQESDSSTVEGVGAVGKSSGFSCSPVPLLSCSKLPAMVQAASRSPA